MGNRNKVDEMAQDYKRLYLSGFERQWQFNIARAVAHDAVSKWFDTRDPEQILQDVQRAVYAAYKNLGDQTILENKEEAALESGINLEYKRNMNPVFEALQKFVERASGFLKKRIEAAKEDNPAIIEQGLQDLRRTAEEFKAYIQKSRDLAGKEAHEMYDEAAHAFSVLMEVVQRPEPPTKEEVQEMLESRGRGLGA